MADQQSPEQDTPRINTPYSGDSRSELVTTDSGDPVVSRRTILKKGVWGALGIVLLGMGVEGWRNAGRLVQLAEEGLDPIMYNETQEGDTTVIEFFGYNLSTLQHVLDEKLRSGTNPIKVKILQPELYNTKKEARSVKVPTRPGQPEEYGEGIAGLFIKCRPSETGEKRKVTIIGANPPEPIALEFNGNASIEHRKSPRLIHQSHYGIYAEGVDLTIENLDFYQGDGSGTNNTERAHIFAYNSEIRINNVGVDGSSDNIGTSNVLSPDGKVVGKTSKGLSGIYLLDCSQATIQKVTLTKTSWDGITLNGTNGNIDSATIKGTMLDSSAGIGITQNGRLLPKNTVIIRNTQVVSRIKGIIGFDNVDISLEEVSIDYNGMPDKSYGIAATGSEQTPLNFSMKRSSINGLGDNILATNAHIDNSLFVCHAGSRDTIALYGRFAGDLITITPDSFRVFRNNTVQVNSSLYTDCNYEPVKLFDVLFQIWSFSIKDSDSKALYEQFLAQGNKFEIVD